MRKIIIGTLVLILILFFVPFRLINWGKISWQPVETVTVSGVAISNQTNEVASFSAGVMVEGSDKNKAIDEVNKKMSDLIKAVKDFGIGDKDIKTQNISYYQIPKGSINPGQWQVNNNLEITLRDVSRASDLADLLAKSGANNVYGPNFRLDENNQAANGLFNEAINDAKSKAGNIAKASGRKLGKILSVTEGATSNGLYPMFDRGMGGGAPIEPGTQSVSKSVTVVFELK